jgi:hypothetical protein
MELIRIGGSRKRSEILEQEIPDLEKAILRARHSQTEGDFPQLLQQQQQQQPRDPPCCCPHLRKILPDELVLDFITTPQDGFYIKNPVHALHLESQFDPKEEITDWLVYGEEQERALAFTTPGIVETWTSTVKNDLYPELSTTLKASPQITSLEGPHQATVVPQSQFTTSSPDIPTPTSFTPSTALVTGTAAMDPSILSATGVAPTPKPDEGTISEEQYKQYYQAEEEIRRLRQALIGRRKTTTLSTTNTTKRPKLKVEDPTLITQEEFQDYKDTQRSASGKANRILETYRQQRRHYWKEQEPKPPKLFGQIEESADTAATMRCHKCSDTKQLRRCLECSFVGCAENHHSFEHYLISQHEFGASITP